MLEFEHDDGMVPPGTEHAANDTARRGVGHFDEMDSDDLRDALLAAVVKIAVKSRRRQADLSAAIARAGIKASAVQVRDALIQLEQAGCIRDILHLYDGGVLLTVTNMGMDRPGRNPHWRFLEKLTPFAA